MGHRELRPVPLDWEHPQAGGTYRDGSPRYIGLHSRADLLSDLNDYAANPEDWEDGPPDPAGYMPEIPEGTPFGWQLYETTSEGSPVSPVFGTLEELAEWCETGAAVFADQRWTAGQWLASFKTDSLDVMSLAYGRKLHVGDPLKGS